MESNWFPARLPEACNFIKKRLWHRCFPVNFAKFLRTPFLQSTSGQLLLNLKTYPVVIVLKLVKDSSIEFSRMLRNFVILSEKHL